MYFVFKYEKNNIHLKDFSENDILRYSIQSKCKRTNKIDAYLSKGQLKSLNSGKPFQLKNHQLMEPTEKTDNHVKLQVNHNHF